jgi:hypothetical protein
MYFKFQIPLNADGTRISYSPGWHGTLDHCPKNVVVDLYDDVQGYGLAHTTDTAIPKVLEARTEAQVKTKLSSMKEADGVYFGENINRKWDKEKAEMEKAGLNG